jgi:predicted GIY-YIG superfamily endonuclease
MYYVYLLENGAADVKRYIGITCDLRRRLAEHNAGKSIHTARFKPWHLVMYLAFRDQQRARDFERYLKSGSGHASRESVCGRPLRLANERSDRLCFLGSWE